MVHGSNHSRGKRISSKMFRPSLGPTQPLIQWMPGFFFPLGGFAARADVIHSPLDSAEVKNE